MHKKIQYNQCFSSIPQNKGSRELAKYSLYLVGSTISGFGLDTSDVDMCLVARSNFNIDPRSEALIHLSSLKTHLERTSGK